MSSSHAQVCSKIPGVSIAVIKDDRVEWAAGFGMSDTAHQVKVTPDTLFQAASVSKAISAIALMIALEEHKLSVDDEVNATPRQVPILMTIYGKPFSEIMADVVLKPLHLRESTFDQPTPNALTPKIAVPYVTDGQHLPDGPRVFDTAASGGLTTTPTELAELIIAVQKALAGTPQGRITPEIAKAIMVRQPGETPPSKCLPSSEPNKPNAVRYIKHATSWTACRNRCTHK
jgi:CubicO group peptidase (beta-lactamase class C family)